MRPQRKGVPRPTHQFRLRRLRRPPRTPQRALQLPVCARLLRQCKDRSGCLQDARRSINGTFLTEAHITTQLSPQKLATASYWASELDPNNFGWSVVNGTCVGRPFRFGLHGHKACFDFKMSMDHSSATFELGNWTVKVHGSRSCKGCLVAGPEHRLDIGFTARGDAPARDKPHGIVGQSYATPGLERHGKKDLYPFSGSYTTSAQAEGAIDGTASDYQVASPYATDFAFSRFNAARGAPASAEATGGVDASSIDRIADPAAEAERRRLSEAPCPPSAAGVAALPPPIRRRNRRHRRRNRRRQQDHPTPRAGKMASPTTFATRTTRREYIETTRCIATHQRVRRPQAKILEVSAFSTTTTPPTHATTTSRCTPATGTTDTGKACTREHVATQRWNSTLWPTDVFSWVGARQ